VAEALRAKASFNDFNFTHHIDKASPVLLRACATGELINEATITVRKAGKGERDFLTIKMNDVLITTVAPSGAGDDTAENVALQFAKVALEIQAAKGRRVTGCRRPFQVRHQRQQERVAEVPWVGMKRISIVAVTR
jgi:type VI secretion system secreted protein Hcp